MGEGSLRQCLVFGGAGEIGLIGLIGIGPYRPCGPISRADNLSHSEALRAHSSAGDHQLDPRQSF